METDRSRAGIVAALTEPDAEYQCGTVRLQLPDLTLTEFVPMDQLEKIADAASVAGTLAPSVHMLLGSEFNCLGV